MLDRFLAGVIRLVRERRLLLVGLVVLLTVVSAVSLRWLEADPSPRALLASADTDQEQISNEFRTRFGSTDNMLAILIEAPKDVITPSPLGYMYALGEAVSKMPHIERVESLARTPFPQTGPNPKDDELSLEALEESPDPLKDDPNLTLALSDVVASAPELFPLGLASLSERAAGMRNLAPLITSDKPDQAQADALKAAVEKMPILRGRLISKDGRLALVAVAIDDALTSHNDLSKALKNVTDWIAAHPAPSELKVQVTGLPVVRTSIVESMRRDQRLLTPATLVVSLIMLLFAFRWWPGVLFPLLKVGLTSLWVLGGMALCSIKLNVINNILPALLIIMGLSDAIHLVARYLHETGRSRDSKRAMSTTIAAIGHACFGTASTTAAGLFALWVSKTRMLAEFGIVGGIGVMVSYLDTVVFLPAMLQSFTPPAHLLQEQEKKEQRPSPLDAILSQVTLKILRQPKVVLAISILLTLGSAITARELRVDSALLDQFEKDDPMYKSTRLLEQNFEGVRPLEVSLSSTEPGRFLDPDTLKQLATVTTWLNERPEVLSATDPSMPFVQVWSAFTGTQASVGDALRTKPELAGLTYVLGKRTPNPLAALLSSDGSHARLRIRLRDDGSRATLKLIDQLDSQLKKAFAKQPDVTYAFTGDAYLSSHGLDAVVTDLTGSLGVAVATILVLVFFSFRSWRYALLLIPPNVIPMVLVMAWMVWRNIPLNAATAIIFSVSIGITVDAGIHLLARLREELGERILLTTAIMRSVRGTGSAIVLACTTLVLGFAALLLSNFVPVQRFAELIAVSIASCILSTLLVLPAVLQVAGRRFVSPEGTAVSPLVSKGH
ncbi:MAG: efflux RND transporter permease subunit [Myxococcales bacterium]